MQLKYNETFKTYLTKPSIHRYGYKEIPEHLNYKECAKFVTGYSGGVKLTQYYKRKVRINDLEFMRYDTKWLNDRVPLLHYLISEHGPREYGGAEHQCDHGKIDLFDKKQNALSKPDLENARLYYSMLFSVLSSGARLDVVSYRGRNAVQSCCCYETSGFLLAYAALYPDSEQSKTVIPMAFADTQNRIFDLCIEKQRLLNIVEKWIPIMLESSIRTKQNLNSPYVSSAAKAQEVFERFKTLIPNLNEPDLKMIVIDQYSREVLREIDVKDYKVSHSHYCGTRHNGVSTQAGNCI